MLSSCSALFGRLFPRVTNVQAQLHYLNGNLPALKAIDQLQTAADAEAERLDWASTPLKIDLPAALTIRNLGVKFDERTVLDRINMTVPISGLVAVVGRSGAGKSTLVHTLLGLVEPNGRNQRDWEITSSLPRRSAAGVKLSAMCRRRPFYFMPPSGTISLSSAILPRRRPKSNWRHYARMPTTLLKVRLIGLIPLSAIRASSFPAASASVWALRARCCQSLSCC